MTSRTSEIAERARLRAELDAAVPRLLPAFLAKQRWFGGKGRSLREARLQDLAWIPSEAPSALGIVRVAYDEGPADRYVLLLGWTANDRGDATLGRCEGPAGLPWLAECSGDPDVSAALLRGFCAPHVIATDGGGTVTYADVAPGSPRALDRAVVERREVRPLPAEQSNTTLRVGAAHVFKLFRRLEAGENPEAEVTRFLTSVAAFDGCPGLRGSLGYSVAGAATGTLGVLEDWVENRGDGWSHALRLLRRAAPDEDGLPHLLADLGVLGRVTADFHLALASSEAVADFMPAPFTAADRDAAVRALRDRARGLFERLRAALPRLAPEHRTPVEELLGVEATIRAWEPPPIEGRGHSFHAIRIHGDYHLGQTLKTAHGFVVIDFEGEPAVPSAERRRRQPALRDVAGMLRSFDYAAVAAEAGRDEAAVAEAMRDAYLASYLERVGTGGAAILPGDPAARAGWIRFFELAKALYEVEYELDNRPAWMTIPLRGVRRLLAAGPAHSEAR